MFVLKDEAAGGPIIKGVPLTLQLVVQLIEAVGAKIMQFVVARVQKEGVPVATLQVIRSEKEKTKVLTGSELKVLLGYTVIPRQVA